VTFFEELLRARKRNSPSFHKSRINLIQNYVNLKNTLVLDIGCGKGEYDNLFIENKAIVMGCDIYIPGIIIANKRNNNVHYIITDAMNLPLRNYSIEFIFINEVLEHIKDDDKCIKESYRVLKENKIIAIFAPNKFFPWETHLRIKKFPSLFLSFLPINFRKIIFKIFKQKYISIYTRKTLYEKLKKYYNIINYHEIFPRIRQLSNKKYYYKIKKMIEKLEKTHLKIFGISIFIIGQKR